MKISSVLIVLLLLTGCSPHSIKLYDGPDKPDAQVSIIRLWSPKIEVVAIDGQPGLDSGRETHAYILPGKHKFSVKFVYGTTFSDVVDINAMTEAGHTYIFTHAIQRGGVMDFIMEDKGTAYDSRCLLPTTTWSKLKKEDDFQC